MQDVCLILEGTYPYVAGGVSGWVYDLIKRLNDRTFSVVYLGAHCSGIKKMHYELPPNVVDFQELHLFDYYVEKEKKQRGNRKRSFQIVEDFLWKMKKRDLSGFPDLLKVVGDRTTRTLDLHDLAYSPESWEIIERLYGGEAEAPSLIDYFWTWRFLYLPIFSLLRSDLPKARVYHSASTGYAGVLGTMAKLRTGRPLMVTEHGIYTRERKIEIARADWIYSKDSDQLKVSEGTDFFKQWWIDIFTFFSRLVYDHADEIITLYEENRQIQIEEGADLKKTKVIPNGVEVESLASLAAQEHSGVLNVGFVGRVVSIKDVKTFLMACRIIHEEMENARFFVMGPTDEDEEYYHECRLLVEMESLQDHVTFTGKVNLKEYYRQIDVLVLTSISEAQPIVVLEAAACGIPVVATEVGACAELILGSTPDDRLLGECGFLTPIRDSGATAQAVLKILRDPVLRARMGAVGQKRVSAYYQMDDLIASYENIYTYYGEKISWPA